VGGLESCEATILPQILGSGAEKHFQIMVSVTKRDSDNPDSAH